MYISGTVLFFLLWALLEQQDIAKVREGRFAPPPSLKKPARSGGEGWWVLLPLVLLGFVAWVLWEALVYMVAVFVALVVLSFLAWVFREVISNVRRPGFVMRTLRGPGWVARPRGKIKLALPSWWGKLRVVERKFKLQT